MNRELPQKDLITKDAKTSLPSPLYRHHRKWCSEASPLAVGWGESSVRAKNQSIERVDSDSPGDSRQFSNSEVSVLNLNHMLDSVRSANLVNCDISMVEHGRERPVCREGFDIKLFPLERAKVDIRDSISLQYLLGFGTAFVACFDIR